MEQGTYLIHQAGVEPSGAELVAGEGEALGHDVAGPVDHGGGLQVEDDLGEDGLVALDGLGVVVVPDEVRLS